MHLNKETTFPYVCFPQMFCSVYIFFYVYGCMPDCGTTDQFVSLQNNKSQPCLDVKVNYCICQLLYIMWISGTEIVYLSFVVWA